MTQEKETRRIVIPEVTRVEGHSAVTVDIKDGAVVDVKLDVFEGTRFFERIVVGHKADEMAHLTSRICAICSTGHVLASIRALEATVQYKPSVRLSLFRELMHLGMIIESHATHLCALVLPDFLGTKDLLTFADKFKEEFALWTTLRSLGCAIQTMVGGRPFHPVNLHVFKLSHYPSRESLESLLPDLKSGADLALKLAHTFLSLKLPNIPSLEPNYLCLEQDGVYGYFGDHIRSSEGFRRPISEYKEYLSEYAVTYSHAKKSRSNGKPYMVGAIARLHFYHELLGSTARSIYMASDLARGSCNSMLNNLAQAIELVQAIERVQTIIALLSELSHEPEVEVPEPRLVGSGVGAVECPRGTLYHSYEVDEQGVVIAADMITPSAQNTERIERDIRNTVSHRLAENGAGKDENLECDLETLIRSYDPCNTCATHAVRLRYV